VISSTSGGVTTTPVVTNQVWHLIVEIQYLDIIITYGVANIHIPILVI